MSALSDKALERRDIRNFADLTRLTPGLDFQAGGDRGLNTIAIVGSNLTPDTHAGQC